MPVTDTRYEHVVLDESGTPTIAGTTMKVVELVLEQMASGSSPEELRFQHPYLTLGQIHSALAYYWDHHEALDDDVARRLDRVDQLRGEALPSPLIARLRREGLL
jgi:uncharacterized protein (DUF433 family)